MQGTFRPDRAQAQSGCENLDEHLHAGAGTDWANILDPKLDETTERHYRDQAGGDMLGDGSDDPMAEETPVPPPLRFQYKGVTFFVLEQASEAKLAPLERGQLLVPYSVHEDTSGEDRAVPYPRPQRRQDRQAVAKEKQANARVLFDPLPPDTEFCRRGVHYVLPGPGMMQIGRARLQRVLERAQDKDLRFARRMEGLSNVASSVVWDCLDPNFNPGDRQAVMDVFMGKYFQRFYKGVTLMSKPPPRDSLAEGVRRHKAFCKEWARQHHRTLTPYVTAPAEVLTLSFYPNMTGNRTADGALLSCPEMARLFMRYDATCVEFASCLQYFVATIDQSRGTRNSSYKQMNTVTLARNQEMRSFGATLSRALTGLRAVFEAIRDDPEQLYFSEYTVDWYDILGQIPDAHPAFDDVAAFGLNPWGEAPERPGDAPWRAMHQ